MYAPLEFHITFWDEDIGRVVERLLQIVDITSETAEDLLAYTENILRDVGLQGNILRQLMHLEVEIQGDKSHGRHGRKKHGR